MNKYTSIELSRLIQSKVPEVETEYGWTNEGHGDKWYIVPRDQQYWDTYYSVSVEHNAYRLDDVLRAIKVWGEKQGWKPTEYTIGDSRVCLIHGDEDLVDCDGTEYDPGGLGCAMCGDSIGDLVYRDEYHCHRLLTAYIEDGLQFGERCERVIKSIFEV